jgi:4-hydroxy-2-oxoheptanedioate aldolase
MQKSLIKERLKDGACVYGTSLEDCLHSEMPVILAAAGLDFFFVDTEHSPASYSQIQMLCRVARGVGIAPLARVSENQPYLISRMLDIGVTGVIVPQIHSVEAAKAAVAAVRYPPLGRRGAGWRSIITDLEPRPAGEEVESINRETMAILMIESKEGLEHVEEIASVPGVDVLFIGPYDLTLSHGMVEQFSNPRFWGFVDRVQAASEKAGIAVGLQTGEMSILLEAYRRGARFLIYSNDAGILLDGYRRAMHQLKEGTSAAPLEGQVKIT